MVEFSRAGASSLRDVTVADAARADIILIALHNATDPLWMLRAWVDAWSNRRETEEGALVLLLPTPSEEASNPAASRCICARRLELPQWTSSSMRRRSR